MKHTNQTPVTLRHHRQRGSVYILVLSVSMIVTVIGLSALMANRIQRRVFEGTDDAFAAMDYAQSAIDLALLKINSDTNWHQTYTHNTWVADQPIGRGTFRWKLVDSVDTDLNNGNEHPARLVAWGMVGQTTQKASVLLNPIPGAPLEILTTAAYAVGNITASGMVTALGGPFATEGIYANGNTTNGDVEANAVVNAAGITGTVTAPAPPKQMPSPTVFDLYRSKATEILFSDIPGGTITLVVLSATSNPYGPTNDDGIYRIDVPPGGVLTVSRARLVASLVVTLGAGATFKTNNQLVWEKPSGRSPVLMVETTAASTIDLNGTIQALDESAIGVNLNPPGTPFNGVSDTDISDSYPSEVSGLIHFGSTVADVVGTGNNFQLFGTLICDSNMTFGSNLKVTRDPSLYSQPPEGYREATIEMKITPGSWKKEVD